LCTHAKLRNWLVLLQRNVYCGWCQLRLGIDDVPSQRALLELRPKPSSLLQQQLVRVRLRMRRRRMPLLRR
jgi:hypothetical protein